MKELKNLHSLNDKKLLVVLPVNKVNDFLLNECAYSLAEQTYPIDVLVLTNGLTDEQTEIVKSILDKPQLSISKKNENGEIESETIIATGKINYTIESSENYTFSTMFNEVFNYATVNDYKWMSIVEPDDVLDFKWYNTFDKFSNEKEYDGYFPIMREINNGQLTGFFNEANWADGMAEVAGVFDLNLLLKFSCINLTGGILNVESIKNYSENIDGVYKPIKESIKISSIYEFFLRMIYNDLKLYTIPRIGYEHRSFNTAQASIDPFVSKTPSYVLGRAIENGEITGEEYKFWNELAIKEYYFEEDRKLEYIVEA